MSDDLFTIVDKPAPGSNLPEFSVTEIAGGIKRTLEDAYGRVRVRGEISQPKLHTSGHLYLDIKDENACMAAVCWKGTLNKLSIRPEHGMEVVITGRVTTFAKSSKYQLVIEDMALAGQGALLQLLEARRKQLTAEGLFDAGRKQPLPFLPRRIGVITSETGAVIRDILHRLEDRFPVPVLLWPVAVQGPAAAAQIAAAIQGMNNLPAGIMAPDVIIVARGGGSLEDLMAFNEEIVVRAAAASRIPLISAVGHETDTTLIDFAADMRAPTPTAAAELAVPVRRELLAQLDETARRLAQLLQTQSERAAIKLHSAGRALGTPARLWESASQRLDDTALRLAATLRHLLDRRRQQAALALPHPRQLVNHAAQVLQQRGERLQQAGRVHLGRHQQRVAAQRLPSLAALLAGAQRQLENTAAQLPQRLATAAARKTDKLERAGALLESQSYQKVLQRGFALVRRSGEPVTQAAMLKNGDKIEITFGDGSKNAEITR